MITFKTFLEAKVKPLNIEVPKSKNNAVEQILTIVNNNCSNSKWMLETNSFLYRGDSWMYKKLKGGFGIVNTAESERKSENTSNWYTVIFDNHPEYSTFPKRSQSIICTNSASRADNYAFNGDILVLIPFNSCKIGSITRGDMWDTKIKLGSIKNDINDINGFFDDISRSFKVPKTWEGLVNFGKKLKANQELRNDFIDFQVYEYYQSKAFAKSMADDFIGTIFKVYSKINTGFESLNTNTLKSSMAGCNECEYWVSGKILIIQNSFIEEVLDGV